MWSFLAVAILVTYAVIGVNAATGQWRRTGTRATPRAIVGWLACAMLWLPIAVYMALSLPKDT